MHVKISARCSAELLHGQPTSRPADTPFFRLALVPLSIKGFQYRARARRIRSYHAGRDVIASRAILSGRVRIKPNSGLIMSNASSASCLPMFFSSFRPLGICVRRNRVVSLLLYHLVRLAIACAYIRRCPAIGSGLATGEARLRRLIALTGNVFANLVVDDSGDLHPKKKILPRPAVRDALVIKKKLIDLVPFFHDFMPDQPVRVVPVDGEQIDSPPVA